MRFSKLSQYWQELEGEASRNEMMAILAEMLEEADAEEVDKVCYLSLGRLGPLFSTVEFNMAEKMMIRAVAGAYGAEEREVRKRYKQRGDLGLVVEELAETKFFSATNSPLRCTSEPPAGMPRQTAVHGSTATSQPTDGRRAGLRQPPPTKNLSSASSSLVVTEIYSKLLRIAKDEGKGSQEKKLQGVAQLLQELDPVSAKYVVRIPLKKMRLGFSDKTILDALSFMRRGNKSGKRELEDAYKVRPDIGRLARIVKEKGIRGVSKLREPEVGVPILMAKAQRMSSAEEILLKIGECAVENKIDGFRLQCHYVAKQKTKNKKQKTQVKNKKMNNNEAREQRSKNIVKLFTRNLDDVTHMYPDIVEAVKKQVKAESAIFEGEAVAYNPRTGEFLPFQETVQRKRKYEIEKFARKVPLKLMAFDCLYLNGKSLLNKAYERRRQSLEQIIKVNKAVAKKETHMRGKFSNGEEIILVVEENVVDKEEKLEQLFEESVSRGLEGVMAKRLDAPYQAGARNWNWIKYKRSYSGELADTIDCLVMGYDLGRGKRVDFGIGGFLVGVYDERKDVFSTVSKVGTGLTDKQWRELKVKSQKLKVKSCPKEYDVVKEVGVDVWIAPKLVVEIEADEITKSPVHTAGLAFRFPRLKRFRDDKKPEQATTMSELKEMFDQQRRHKAQ